MYPNGMLVQALNEKTSFIKHFPYYGIMAYHSFPLIGRTDEESRKGFSSGTPQRFVFRRSSLSGKDTSSSGFTSERRRIIRFRTGT